MGIDKVIVPCVALGLGVAGILGWGAYCVVNQIPGNTKVQAPYIAPSNLKVECKDLDGNGELETIVTVGSKPYLLRDVNGEPVLSAYEIKPAEIILKK